MPPRLVVHDLRKSYLAGFGRCWARVLVLRGLSLTVHRGERLAIVGSAGSGKTTLLHCLAGLRRPEAGHVRWIGAPDDEAARPRRLIASPADIRLTGDDLFLIDMPATECSPLAEWAEELKASGDAGAGWIVATRYLGPLTALCDTVLVLEEGRLCSSDPGGEAARRVAEPSPHAAARGGPRLSRSCRPCPAAEPFR